MLRLQLSVSAPYIDVQHTSPSTLAEKTHHLELAPWRTKTSLAGHKIKTWYVATKHSRTGIKWREPAVATEALLRKRFPSMLYMYPKMDSQNN